MLQIEEVAYTFWRSIFLGLGLSIVQTQSSSVCPQTSG